MDANLYTVYCGYEFTWYEGLGLLNGRQDYPQVIADGIHFNDAAHILRTLAEKGEPDMAYGMVPTEVWEILKAQIGRSEDNVCPKCGMLHTATERACQADGTRLASNRLTIERLFQRYLDVVHADSGLAVDNEWTDEELFSSMRLALVTED